MQTERDPKTKKKERKKKRGNTKKLKIPLLLTLYMVGFCTVFISYIFTNNSAVPP